MKGSCGRASGKRPPVLAGASVGIQPDVWW